MTALAPDVARRARHERASGLRRRDRNHFAAAPAAGVEETRPGGEATLDDVIVGAWEGLLAHRSVSCPVCSGALAPRYGAGAAPVGGRCTTCSSTLG